MNIFQYKEDANLIRETEVYNVYDLKFGDMNLSLTELHAGQKTKGHSHDVNEVYICREGSGYIRIGDEGRNITEGEVFIIPSGQFHQVSNKTDKDLVFWSIFNTYEGR